MRQSLIGKNEVKEKELVSTSENIMGILPIGKLLTQMGIPLIFSLMVQALYSIVDSIYVARLGGNALTAISLCMTPQYLVMAVGTGIGVGVNTVLSGRLGRKDNAGVDKASGNGLVINWVCATLFILLGLFAVKPFFSMMTDDIEIMQMASDYGSILLIFAFASFHQILMERMLVATGKASGSMISMLVGSLINVILDPIFIFGYWGFPAMGIAGAAYATVFAQGCAAVVGFLLNLHWNKEIRLNFSALKPEIKTMKEIVKIGFPVSLSLAIISILAFGVNGALLRLSSVAPGIYVIYIRLQSFVLMPADGMRDAGISIISYNYGAKSKTRIIETVRKSMIVHLIASIIGMIVFWIAPELLLAIFNASEEMLQVGVPALRIISIAFPLTGATHILYGFLQAMGHSGKTFLVSIVQAIALVGGTWLWTLAGNVDLVWLAFPIMEVIIFGLSLYYTKSVYDRKVKVLE